MPKDVSENEHPKESEDKASELRQVHEDTRQELDDLKQEILDSQKK